MIEVRGMTKIKKFFARISEMIECSRQLRIGLVLFALILLVAIFAPALAPMDPYDLGDDLLVSPGTSGHLLGTTNMGQDVLSMLIYGSRASLLIGIVAAAISGFIGTILGAVSGYYGGKIDKVINEAINIFLMIPTFFLVLIIVAMFGSSMLNVMLVIGLTSWPSNARMMRVQAMSIKERTFVKSSVSMGESKRQILFKYIIPNGLFPIIANTTMDVAKAILTEASLSFLGLGDPNVISWGQMIYDGKQYLSSGWWMSTFAGLMIMVIVMVFYMIGDGLNYALSPNMRKI
jgi:peptide/nickel transport system permease protein